MKNFKQNWILYLILGGLLIVAINKIIKSVNTPSKEIPIIITNDGWTAPSLFTDHLLEGEERSLVIYGEDLIANTSKYLGPNGSVAHITNGMNCQNCHLNAGKKNGEIIMELCHQIIQNSVTEVDLSKQFINALVIAWKEA